MAWSIFAHTAAGSVDAGTSVTTAALDTTGCTLILLGASFYGFLSTPGDFSSSPSNTISLLPSYNDGATCGVKLAYITLPTTSSTQTFTINAPGGGAYQSLMVLGVAGVASPPGDVENGNAPGTAGTTIQPGSITPSQDGDLIVTVLNVNGDESGGNLPSIDNGFTITDTVAYSAGQHFLGSFAYLVQGSAAAINPTWTYGVSHERAAAIAAFKVLASTAFDWMQNAPDRPSHYSKLSMLDSGPTPGRGI
jgi:hypothetical protein